ncbi:MAG: polysaccharide deacetylase family protein [Planctomycetota bacterium]
MSKPIASLSLDLDNKWAYLRNHGAAYTEGVRTESVHTESDDPNRYASYLGEVAPRIVGFFAERELRATVFVVGKDLELADGREAVSQFANAGHEIGNHSQSHFPWLQSLPPEQVEYELVAAEQAIESLTGVTPVGFRAPGFSWSPELLALLVRRNYQYDASTFPTIIGPLARAYSRLRLPSRQSDTEGDPPPQSFASLADAFRPLRPYQIDTAAGPLVEAPVTTMPLLRIPIHVTYLTFLAQFSTAAAKAYLRTALALCRLRGVAPSMLLHPLDFLGIEDEPQLAFFPGMKLAREQKMELLHWLIEAMQQTWRVTTIRDHVAEVCGQTAESGAAEQPASEVVTL